MMARVFRGVAVAATIAALALSAACDEGDEQAEPASPLVTPDAGATSVIDGAEDSEGHAESIRVAAASDLRDVLEVLTPDIEEACETSIVPVFGSSGQLKEQIRAGAGFGLFLSADSAFAAELDGAGLVVPGGLADYAVGQLALVTRDGIQPIQSIDDLTSEEYSRIAIANPAHAPYGRAAEEALQSAGLLDDLRNRLVYGENVRQATDYVTTGNVDAGIVALALVIGGAHPYTIVENSLYTPLVQSGAVIRDTGAELTGRCVLQYLLNSAGQERLRDFGFEVVSQS